MSSHPFVDDIAGVDTDSEYGSEDMEEDISVGGIDTHTEMDIDGPTEGETGYLQNGRFNAIIQQQAQVERSSAEASASSYIQRAKEMQTTALRQHEDDVVHVAYLQPESHTRVYAVKTRIGRELDAVLFGMHNCTTKGAELRGVKSVFCVTNSPGRIYVETEDDALMEKVLHNCIFVSHDAERQRVPSHELPCLLSPVPEVGLEEHSWVKIRGGLYHNDIGQVRGFLQGGSVVEVAVAPRLAPAATLRPRKRLRRQDGRPLPRRLTWQDAVKEYGISTVKTMTEGFQVNGVYIENNGFHVLTVNRNATKVVKPRMQEISMFIDAALEKLISEGSNLSSCTDEDVYSMGHIDIEKLDVDCLFGVGDAVEIIKGKNHGLRGRVMRPAVRHSITLLICNTEDEKGRDFELEENVSFGGSVTVRYGVHEGRTGYVEGTRGAQVFVRDHVTLEELCVYAAFVEKTPSTNGMQGSNSSVHPVQPQILYHNGKANIDVLAHKYMDEVIYVWKGFKKGSVGRVLSIGGTHARVCIGGTGVHTFKRENLLSEQLETLNNGDIPERYRNTIQQEQMILLVNRLIDIEKGRMRYDSSRIRNSDAKRVTVSRYRDNSTLAVCQGKTEGPMMWLFEPKIAELRKTYKIIVKFVNVEGHAALAHRTGKIVKTLTPETFPLSIQESPSVEIEYTDNKAKPRIERIPVSSITNSIPKTKGKLLIVGGNMKGNIVRHCRTIQDNVVVKPVEGGNTFRIPKSMICSLHEDQ
ncbi:hypothetical protein SCHPADRAFT_891181 [Schizopora paradoxa]|uniref:NGN domain-containing protein n=1 Tax=Schizopora paradoxa TaxID=27342 RepID=A0A0H2RJ25_9AGAM|nr:hypothetical protein SCHPADRAFT_891181 [Schizopora paradoxa]